MGILIPKKYFHNFQNSKIKLKKTPKVSKFQNQLEWGGGKEEEKKIKTDPSKGGYYLSVGPAAPSSPQELDQGSPRPLKF